MKTIEITIDVTGPQVKQEITTSGFQGGECQSASAPFEKVGGETVQEEMTAEGQGGSCHFVPAVG